jgi:hypothetical protein
MTTKKATRADLEAGDITRFILEHNDSNDAQKLAYYHHLGLFRIRAELDETYSFNNLCGDMFNPIVNPSIPPAQLERDKRALQSRVRRMGVWSAVLELRKSSADPWIEPAELDTYLGGSVGTEFIGSGYDHEFLVSALEWLEGNKVVETDPQAALIAAAKKALCGMRALIATRPELAGDIQPYCKRLFDALDPYDMPGTYSVSPPGVTVAPVEPLLGYDGFGFNVIADEFKGRFATVQKEYKPGGSKDAEGAEILTALLASGVVTRNY